MFKNLSFKLFIYVFFLSFGVYADYVIISKYDHGHEIGVVDDADKTQLYDILLNNTWPTSQLNQHRDPKKTEEEQLAEALSKNTALDGKYAFVWIPDTIHDLHCASTLLSQNKTILVDKKPILQEYALEESGRKLSTGKRFYLYSGGKVDDLIAKNKFALTNSFRDADSLNAYFNEYNKRGESAYFLCNDNVVNLLKETVSKSRFTAVTKLSIEQILANRQQLKNLRAKVADRYIRAVKDYNGKAPHHIIEIKNIETQPDVNTIIDEIISIEIDAHRNNKGLLFRGTGGLSIVNGEDAIDYPYYQGAPKSLSFATTVYSGLFRESGSLEKSADGNACPMNYGPTATYFYALPIDKRSSDWLPLFEIPPLALIGRLFSAGEYWHARSKVGIKELTQNELQGAVGSIYGSKTLEEYSSIGYLVVNDETTATLAQKIAAYIADHSIIFSSKGMFDANTATLASQAKRGQRNLINARSSVNPDISRMINLLEHENKKIRLAAVEELIWFKEMITRRDVNNIMKLLSHKDEAIIEQSIMLLHHIDFSSLIDSIKEHEYIIATKLLTHESFNVRNMAQNYIVDYAKTNNQLLDLVAKFLDADNKDIQLCALNLFGMVKPKDTKLQCRIAEKIKDQDRKIKLAVVQVFYSMENLDEQVLEILQKSLGDEDVSGWVSRILKTARSPHKS